MLKSQTLVVRDLFRMIFKSSTKFLEAGIFSIDKFVVIVVVNRRNFFN